MSLLESFLLSFQTDAGKASNEVKDLNKNLDNTDDSAKKAAQGVDVMVKSVAGLLAAYVSLDAIQGKILGQALAVDTIGKFSETLGFNAQQVDAWGAAVERNGGSAEGFRATLAGLNDQLKNQAAFGTGDIAQTLSRVGVNPFDDQGSLKDTFDIMLELSDVFKDMSKQDSSLIGKKLGLDQGTILLLQQSRYSLQNLVEQQRQFGGVTDASYKASADFNDEMDNSKRIFNAWFQTANTTILPILTKMSQGFRGLVDWMGNHKDLIVGFMTVIGGAGIARLIPILISAAKYLRFLLNPIALVATAFAILYEDVKAYLGGQESLIGDLAKKYEWFGKVVDGVIAGIKFTFEQLEKDLDWVKLLFDDPMEALDQLKQGFLDLFNYIVGLFDFSFIGDGMDGALGQLKQGFLDLFNYIVSLFDFSFIGDGIDGALDIFGGKKIKLGVDKDAADLPMFGENGVIENTMKGLAIQKEYASSPINSMGGSSYFNSSAIQKSISISMGGVNVDARGMSKSEARDTFGENLQTHLANAIGQFDDGVDR